MAKEMKYGEWAFLGGLVLAIILGIGSSFIGTSMLPIIWAVLAILGLIVGLLNVTAKEVNNFLVATIALLLASSSIAPIMTVFSSITAISMLATALSGFLGALIAFISPAAFIVALKAIYEMAKSD